MPHHRRHAHHLALAADVAALLDEERRRTGETLRQVANRMMRRGFQRAATDRPAVELPLIDGALVVDVSDVSAVLAELDDDRHRDQGPV